MANDDKKLKQVRILVELFLNNDYPSDVQLSKMTGISSSTVGRRLTDKEAILEAYPNGESLYLEIMKARALNKDKARVNGAQVSNINNSPTPKLKLSLFGKNEASQIMVLTKAALTFRTTLDTLVDLFGIEKEELLLMFHNSDIGTTNWQALEYVFYMENANQDVAKAKFMEFYLKLLKAVMDKNEDVKNFLVGYIFDGAANNLIKRHQVGDIISDDDLSIIINYQLKYSLRSDETCLLFGIDRPNYERRLTAYFQSHSDIENKYKNLIDFIQSHSKFGSGGRNGS